MYIFIYIYIYNGYVYPSHIHGLFRKDQISWRSASFEIRLESSKIFLAELPASSVSTQPDMFLLPFDQICLPSLCEAMAIPACVLDPVTLVHM